MRRDGLLGGGPDLRGGVVHAGDGRRVVEAELVRGDVVVEHEVARRPHPQDDGRRESGHDHEGTAVPAAMH